MADVIAQQNQAERSPNWQDYYQQISGMRDTGDVSFFPAGTKTMRAIEDDSANKRHSQSIAQADRSDAMRYKMHAETLAYQRWIDEQRLALDWAELNATLRALDGAGQSSVETVANAFGRTKLSVSEGNLGGGPATSNISYNDRIGQAPVNPSGVGSMYKVPKAGFGPAPNSNTNASVGTSNAPTKTNLSPAVISITPGSPADTFTKWLKSIKQINPRIGQ